MRELLAKSLDGPRRLNLCIESKRTTQFLGAAVLQAHGMGDDRGLKRDGV